MARLPGAHPDFRRRRGVPHRWHLFVKTEREFLWTSCGLRIDIEGAEAEQAPTPGEPVCQNCRRLAERRRIDRR